MKKITAIMSFGLVIAFLSGCATLTLTPKQALQEYSGINDKTIYEYYGFRYGLITVIGHNPRFNNGLKYIYAYNKKNQQCKVKIDHNTTLRITKNDGRKINMYFDTSFMKDSCLYGNRSHLINLPVGPFKITTLKKIEIQTTANKVTVE